MDANELKDAMEHAGRALADELVKSAAEKRAESDARLVAELRLYVLRRLKHDLGSERRANREEVLDAVGSYCAKARADALDKLRNDKRMPQTINYLERYNALLKMDDRSEVLRRLDQTIAKAEAIIAEAEKVDVDAALADAASSYAEQVGKLNGIIIADAEEQIADETAAPPKSLVDNETAQELDLDELIEDTFDAAMGPTDGVEAEQLAQAADQDARLELLAKQISKAATAVEEAVKKTMYSDAESVAGRALTLSELPIFEGGATLTAELDVDELHSLAGEVRTSFRTFRQVVQDNGLFAAFASDGSFGACRGWRFGFWWDDFLYDLSEFEGEIPGQKAVQGIPLDIEEDDGGDTLAKSVERMRGFNKKKYWGMLDDDFDEHVEAFWYGFTKLMEGVNGLYRINPATFNQYCNDIAEVAKQATLDLGAGCMDARQTEEFCKEVERRGRD